MNNLSICIVIILGFVVTSCDQNSKPKIGSWTINRIDFVYADTTYTADPSYGGALVLSPNRYSIAYNHSGAPRQPFQDLSNPSHEEMIQAFRSFAFNTGSYSWAGDTLTCKPDFAKVPGFEGGEQVYLFDRSARTLTMFDETHPNGEKPAWYGKLKLRFALFPEGVQ